MDPNATSSRQTDRSISGRNILSATSSMLLRVNPAKQSPLHSSSR